MLKHALNLIFSKIRYIYTAPKLIRIMPLDLHLPPREFLRRLGLSRPRPAEVYYQLFPARLIDQTLERNEGILSEEQALVIRTGQFTGRSPKDRFIVYDEQTRDSIDWNAINQPMTPAHFERLFSKVTTYLAERELWVRDAYACADPRYRLNIRLLSAHPWASLFCYNMFLRPHNEELAHFMPDWIILHAPGCLADPARDGTRQENFVVLNFTRRVILIGGTAYTGEIKKGVFSVLNYLLPHTRRVLSMHCAANAGPQGDTALFFGLSGTGKTTLSTDPGRNLIGDDEHGWSEDNLFNFEGGCYAKCLNLSATGEPEIYRAIRKGTLVENVAFVAGSRKIDYASQAITENTRVSYPIDYLQHICRPSVGAIPQHLFFLTCDAYGVLPPISRLTPAQAMYHFISGYTAKVAGTEAGIDTPRATFSACFGAPFLPLPPLQYARMLGERMQAASARCWLVNTGWTGGGYGTGKRIALAHTRAMVRAALSGKLDQGGFETDALFGLQTPTGCPGVPGELWSSLRHWPNPQAYRETARQLAVQFQQHFRCFEAGAGPEICAAAPRI